MLDMKLLYCLMADAVNILKCESASQLEVHMFAEVY